MKIVLHVEHVLMNARLKRSLKVIFTKLIRMLAQIVVLVQMFVRQRPFILLRNCLNNKKGIVPKISFCSSRHVERSQNIANRAQALSEMSPRWST